MKLSENGAKQSVKYLAILIGIQLHNKLRIEKRILEFIAVRSFKGDFKSEILGFNGPPEFGKSSLEK